MKMDTGKICECLWMLSLNRQTWILKMNDCECLLWTGDPKYWKSLLMILKVCSEQLNLNMPHLPHCLGGPVLWLACLHLPSRPMWSWTAHTHPHCSQGTGYSWTQLHICNPNTVHSLGPAGSAAVLKIKKKKILLSLPSKLHHSCGRTPVLCIHVNHVNYIQITLYKHWHTACL